MAAPAKTKEVFECLKTCASGMRTVTYGEVGKAVGLDPRDVGVQLGYIRDHVCREQGHPWLNAFVVNTETRLPGEHFLPEAFAHGQAEEKLWWRGMVLQVFTYDWSKVSFE